MEVVGERGGSPKTPAPPEALPGMGAGKAWAGLGWGLGAGTLLVKVLCVTVLEAENVSCEE